MPVCRMGLTSMARAAVMRNVPNAFIRCMVAGRALQSLVKLSIGAALHFPMITVAVAQTPDIGSDVKDVEAVSAAQIVLVVGAPGTTEYREQFREDAQQWATLARNRQMELIAIDDSDAAEIPSHHDKLRDAI